ncbi:MAG: cardiolipin synthase [Planctomycetes bacterium]|nr:cardiolipin synthase [Planctomycetota bacterium]
MTWAALSLALTLVHWAIVALLVPRVVAERRESAATLAWALAIGFLPYVGPLAYYAIGVTRLRRRRRRRDRARRDLAPGLAGVRARLDLKDPRRGGALSAEDLALMRAAHTLQAAPPTPGNRADLLVNGRATFAALTAACEGARTFIHLEYYIFRLDAVGRPLFDLLCRKARAGVEVRLLVDAVGSWGLSAADLAPLVAAGGRFAFFAPVNPFSRLWSLNLRNHRKIVVVDGNTAFTGGVNVGEEYLSGGGEFAGWRDTHLAIEGPAAAALEEIFAEDWHFTCGERLVDARYFPEVEARDGTCVQIVASGPDSEWEAIHRAVFAAVATARERVWMTTPYFVPDPALRVALETTARRGVDVRLLLPGVSDHFLVYHAGRSFYPELLAAGCRLYEYSAGFLHAKSATVDRRWSTVGSANMDRRSFTLNFEANAILYGAGPAEALERQFELDLTRARPVTLGSHYRNRRRLLLESVCRILAPLL